MTNQERKARLMELSKVVKEYIDLETAEIKKSETFNEMKQTVKEVSNSEPAKKMKNTVKKGSNSIENIISEMQRKESVDKTEVNEADEVDKNSEAEKKDECLDFWEFISTLQEGILNFTTDTEDLQTNKKAKSTLDQNKNYYKYNSEYVNLLLNDKIEESFKAINEAKDYEEVYLIVFNNYGTYGLVVLHNLADDLSNLNIKSLHNYKEIAKKTLHYCYTKHF